MLNKFVLSRIGTFNVPSYDIEQADVAPLLSSLIGTSVPVNNFGRLPDAYLNTSRLYLARAMYSNALQMSEQYFFLYKTHELGIFSRFLNDFKQLNADISVAIQNRFESLMKNGQFEEAVSHCDIINYA